ncbi:hypothetical protein [Priestia aryabhattai]
MRKISLILLLLLLTLIFLFIFIIFLKKSKEMFFLISFMPKEKPIKKEVEKHPFIGENLEKLINYQYKGTWSVVLLTYSNCIYCLGVQDEVEKLVLERNLNLIHIFTEFNREVEEVIKKNSEKNPELSYLQYNLPPGVVQKYNLTNFPNYMLVNNTGIVVEVTGHLGRIEYLVESQEIVQKEII